MHLTNILYKVPTWKKVAWHNHNNKRHESSNGGLQFEIITSDFIRKHFITLCTIIFHRPVIRKVIILQRCSRCFICLTRCKATGKLLCISYFSAYLERNCSFSSSKKDSCCNFNTSPRFFHSPEF